MQIRPRGLKSLREEMSTKRLYYSASDA